MPDFSRARFWCIVFLLLLVPAGLSAQETNISSPGAVVRPGDGISVRIWNEPLLTDTFRVSASGHVVLPILGEVHVAGQQPQALQDSLRTAYSVFRSHSATEITVLRRIGVLGEVTRPGLYFADLTMSLRELVATAGGITQQGDPARIYLVRDGEEVRVDEEGIAFSAIQLQSGDQVIVGRRNWFELNLLGITSTAAVLVSVLVPLLQRVF